MLATKNPSKLLYHSPAVRWIYRSPEEPRRQEPVMCKGFSCHDVFTGQGRELVAWIVHRCPTFCFYLIIVMLCAHCKANTFGRSQHIPLSRDFLFKSYRWAFWCHHSHKNVDRPFEVCKTVNRISLLGLNIPQLGMAFLQVRMFPVKLGIKRI